MGQICPGGAFHWQEASQGAGGTAVQLDGGCASRHDYQPGQLECGRWVCALRRLQRRGQPRAVRGRRRGPAAPRRVRP
eukprot:5929011-Lingulodinium_polyedra.AAC.1